jgi:L-alanine-DL-glutamate epimerase-like enolase superfamily enzyme
MLPIVNNGIVSAPTAPGLGLALNPDLRRRADAVVRESKLDA